MRLFLKKADATKRGMPSLQDLYMATVSKNIFAKPLKKVVNTKRKP